MRTDSLRYLCTIRKRSLCQVRVKATSAGRQASGVRVAQCAYRTCEVRLKRTFVNMARYIMVPLQDLTDRGVSRLCSVKSLFEHATLLAPRLRATASCNADPNLLSMEAYMLDQAAQQQTDVRCV
jgi:hypothetical protein